MNRKAVLLILLTQAISVYGVLRIVSVAPISSSWSAVKVMRDGEILWSEMINARGGISVNGTRHLVEVISIDVGAPNETKMSSKVIEAVREVSDGIYGDVHAMFAPYTSQLTEKFAIEADKHQILSCTSGKRSSYASKGSVQAR